MSFIFTVTFVIQMNDAMIEHIAIANVKIYLMWLSYLEMPKLAINSSLNLQWGIQMAIEHRFYHVEGAVFAKKMLRCGLQFVKKALDSLYLIIQRQP